MGNVYSVKRRGEWFCGSTVQDEQYVWDVAQSSFWSICTKRRGVLLSDFSDERAA